jgi:predicted transcriptional regulator
MNLEKLFGSKAKVDILKYLLFKRQGISMRALESELERTFPAIKKQVDSLAESEVIEIDKNSVKRSIRLNKEFEILMRSIFIHSLTYNIKALFNKYEAMISKYYFGGVFGSSLEMDLVVLYQNCEKPQIDKLKEEINHIFADSFIEVVSVVFMSADEREKRYRLADRFVLNILRSLQKV